MILPISARASAHACRIAVRGRRRAVGGGAQARDATRYELDCGDQVAIGEVRELLVDLPVELARAIGFAAAARACALRRARLRRCTGRSSAAASLYLAAASSHCCLASSAAPQATAGSAAAGTAAVTRLCLQPGKLRDRLVGIARAQRGVGPEQPRHRGDAGAFPAVRDLDQLARRASVVIRVELGEGTRQIGVGVAHARAAVCGRRCRLRPGSRARRRQPT